MTKPLRHRKSTYQRGTVACRKCAASIPIDKLTALADEVSVRCPKCGERGLYAKRVILVDEFPERRKALRP